MASRGGGRSARPRASAGSTAAHGSTSLLRSLSGNAHASSSSAANVQRRLPAIEVAVLVHDAATFGVAERGIWHFGNLSAALPRRLWREKDGITILGAAARMRARRSRPRGVDISLPPTHSHGAPADDASKGQDAASTPLPSSGVALLSENAADGASTPQREVADVGADAEEDVIVGSDALPPGVTLVMSPTTHTRYLYAAHRICVAVDTSPSMTALDVHAVTHTYTHTHTALYTYLRGLVAPAVCMRVSSVGRPGPLTGTSVADLPPGFRAGEADDALLVYAPELLVTVITQGQGHGLGQGHAGGQEHVQGAGVRAPGRPRLMPRVLVHGYALTPETVEPLIATLAAGFRTVEREMAASVAATLAAAHADVPSTSVGTGGAAASPSPLLDVSLTELMESAVVVLKLLPSYACPAITLITDGIATLPDSTAYGSIIMQMLRHDIACNVLQVGSCSGVHESFGRVSDTEAMQFLAMSTGGFRIRQRDLPACTVPAYTRLPPVTWEEPLQRGVGSTRKYAHLFSTDAWSKLQVLSFVRTSVLVAAESGQSTALERAISSPMPSRTPMPSAPRNQATDLRDVSTLSADARKSLSSSATTAAITIAAPQPSKMDYQGMLLFMLAAQPNSGSIGRGQRADGTSVGALPSGVTSPPVPRLLSTSKPSSVRQAIERMLAVGSAATQMSREDYAFPWSGPPPNVPFEAIRIAKYKLHVDPRALLECRLKEGFRIVLGGAEARMLGGIASASREQQAGRASAEHSATLIIAWQLQIMILYRFERSSPPGLEDGKSQLTDPIASGRRDTPISRAAPPVDSGSVRTGGGSTVAAMDARFRAGQRDARVTTVTSAPSLPTVRVYVDVFARKDFVALLRATLAKQSQDVSHQLLGCVLAAPSADTTASTGLPAAASKQPAAPGFVAPFRVDLANQSRAKPQAADAQPAKPLATTTDTVRVFDRLTTSATEPRRVAGLVGFLSVMQQVDRALTHLCRVPGPGSTQHVLTHEAGAAVTLTSSGLVPLQPGDSSQAVTIAPARRGTESMRSMSTMMAQEAVAAHHSRPSAFSTVSPSTSRRGSSRVPQLAPPIHPVEAAAPRPRYRPSMDLQLLLVPFASLSVSAWHRWFDVERFEVVVDFPATMLLTATAPEALVADASTSYGFPSIHSRLFAHVLETLQSWADAELPYSEDVFERSEGETGDKPRLVERRTAAARARRCAAEGTRWGSHAAASRPFVRLLGDPTLVEAQAALSAPPRMPSSVSVLTGEHDSVAPASRMSFTARSSGPPVPSSAPAGDEGASGKAPRRAEAPASSVSKRALSFVLARAEVLAGADVTGLSVTAKHLEHACSGTSEPARCSIHALSALVAVHVAFFNCPPPVRVRQLAELRSAIEGAVPVPVHASTGSSPSSGKPSLISANEARRSLLTVTTPVPTPTVLQALSSSSVAAARPGTPPVTAAPPAAQPLPERTPSFNAARHVSRSDFSDTASAGEAPPSGRASVDPLPSMVNEHEDAADAGRVTSDHFRPSSLHAASTQQALPVLAIDSARSSPAAIALAESAQHAALSLDTNSPSETPNPSVVVHAEPLVASARVRVAPCPLARIMTGHAHMRNCSLSSPTDAPLQHRLFSEVATAEDRVRESMCCGGTSIPPEVLQAVLWHRSWGYRIVAPSGTVAGDVFVRDVAAVMTELLAARLRGAASQATPGMIDASQWQLMTWDIAKVACAGEAASVSMPVKAQFSLVFPVATPKRRVPGPVFAAAADGKVLDAVGQPHRQQIAVLQQVVRLHVHTHTHSPTHTETEAHISVGMWMEPQFGYVQLHMPSDGAHAPRPPTMATARDAYAALVSHVYAADVHTLTHTCGSVAPGVRTYARAQIHVCDAMHHTLFPPPQIPASAEGMPGPSHTHALTHTHTHAHTLPQILLPFLPVPEHLRLRLRVVAASEACAVGLDVAAAMARSHTHTHTHTHGRARTHAHAHTHAVGSLTFEAGALWGSPPASSTEPT